MKSSKRDFRDSGLAITVSLHAIQRHLLRSRTAGSHESVVSRLRTAVQGAVDRQELQRADRSTFLTPVHDGSHEPLWAVLSVSGPIEKPFAIVVCTVLTSAMVTRSFNLNRQPRYAAA